MCTKILMCNVRCMNVWQHILMNIYEKTSMSSIYEETSVSSISHNIYFQFINIEKIFNISDVCMYKKYIMFYIKVLM